MKILYVISINFSKILQKNVYLTHVQRIRSLIKIRSLFHEKGDIFHNFVKTVNLM